MRTSIGSPTKHDINRWQLAQEAGCIACVLDGTLGVPGDVHHLLSGGKRISHAATVILCPWHHRALCEEGKPLTEMEKEYGPALAANPKAFHQKYGAPKELLETQEAIITKLKELARQ